MERLDKQQLIICSLVSLLVCVLAWHLFMPGSEPDQGKASGESFFTESPIRENEDYPTSSPLWLVNVHNIAFVQSAIVKDQRKGHLNRSSNVQSTVYYCKHTIASNYAAILLHIINSPNTVFKFTSSQNYQDLDIPPPHAPPSL